MDITQTYALVIGINTYQSPEFSNLEAAVNDADSMDKFLRTFLFVPEKNIINLRNKQASRQGILDGFRTLSKISSGSTDPCIIIFYAGHGARAQKPLEWKDWASDTEHVEMLCPSDMGMPRVDDAKRKVEGIPDRTVCYLLNHLSTTLGNNITLILDCCCSAGLNRGVDDMGTPRQIPNPPALSGEPDTLVLPEPSPTKPEPATRGMRTHPGFGGMYQDSHVLLAACGRDRVAFENKGRGLFTSTLLPVLQQVDYRTTTYASLMKRLKMPKWQTPHCEGRNMDRPLFDRRGNRADPSFISCTRVKDDKGQLVVTMDAGLAQGVHLGELFSVHNSNLAETKAVKNPSIGILNTISVGTGSSSLEAAPGYPKFKIPRNFYVKSMDWSSDPPKVYCNDKKWLKSVFPPGKGEVAIVDEKKASLVLTLTGEEVLISRTDKQINAYVPNPFGHALNKDDHTKIRVVVRAWQRFNFHLHRKGKNRFDQVRMEMHYLEPTDTVYPDPDSSDSQNYKAKEPNLLTEEPSTIHLPDPDVDKPLGITLHNDSDTPMYPYLFYFDPNELTILPWFTGPQGAGLGDVDPPLGAHSSLPIGYGNGGATPWQFCFEGDRTKDVGFFKLFLSVSPANFSSVIQEESPFEFQQSRGANQSRGKEEELEEEELDADSWGAKVATIIQLREYN